MTQTFYFQKTSYGIELCERQFDGIENAQHRTLARINLSEAMRLQEALGKAIQCEQERERARIQKDLHDKRARLASLREEVQALESELEKS